MTEETSDLVRMHTSYDWAYQGKHCVGFPGLHHPIPWNIRDKTLVKGQAQVIDTGGENMGYHGEKAQILHKGLHNDMRMW